MRLACVVYNISVQNLDSLFERLGRSAFRSRFRLRQKELEYLRGKGLDTVLDHARAFIDERLAPADIPNDGKQTPMRNHPAFIAQHATATCCRKCLQKWHGIPREGHELTPGERDYVVSVIRKWLSAYD